MQTLNVSAGRSDQDYKAAEEHRLADLRSDVQSYAMYFFVAAGLAGLGTGLLPIRLFAFVNIGFIDLLTFYGGELVRANLLCCALRQPHGCLPLWVWVWVWRGARASVGPFGLA